MAGNADITAAYNWAVAKCNAPNVGYSQTYRAQKTVNGITYYDCSSFIWYALKKGGFDVVEANGGSTYPFTTSTMSGVLEKLGFHKLNPFTGWHAGDIGVDVGNHTEMVYEPKTLGGICMGAHTSGVPLEDQVSIGSSSGDPNYVRPPSDWDEIWRYDGTSPSAECSIYVVAALCGNFWQESNINPGLWESLREGTFTELNHGFGLGQWTNTGGDTRGRLYKLHQYLKKEGYADDSGEGQLEFLRQEKRWLPSDQYGEQFGSLKEFLNSDSEDLTLLTHAFNNAWEGIHDDSWDIRVQYAHTCQTYIEANADNPDITDWIVRNDYLTEPEILNNAVMVWRILGLGDGGGGGNEPVPDKKKSKSWLYMKSPLWYMPRRI